MTELTEITCAREGRIGLVTLTRPDKLNAYTPDMGEELVAVFRELLGDSGIGAIVLTGAGEGFCAGADRAYFAGKVSRGGKRIGEEWFLNGFAAELAAAEKPLLAAVNGVATGIGMTMLLPFDLRIASERAGFHFPFAQLGVVPAFASSYFLPQLVGQGKARELLLYGGKLSAHKALQIGLVNRVVAADKLLPETLAMASAMADAPSGFVRLCKGLLRDAQGATLQQCMAGELEAVRRMAEIKSNN